MYELRKKEYLYKENNQGSLVTSVSRLADEQFGSALKTFRKIQEEKSMFPSEFWQ